MVRGCSDEIIACAQIPRARIQFKVVSCTDYSDRSRTSLRDMEDIAWVLRSDPHRRQVGFVHASKLDELERHVLEDDDF